MVCQVCQSILHTPGVVYSPHNFIWFIFVQQNGGFFCRVRVSEITYRERMGTNSAYGCTPLLCSRRYFVCCPTSCTLHPLQLTCTTQKTTQVCLTLTCFLSLTLPSLIVILFFFFFETKQVDNRKKKKKTAQDKTHVFRHTEKWDRRYRRQP